VVRVLPRQVSSMLVPGQLRWRGCGALLGLRVGLPGGVIELLIGVVCDMRWRGVVRTGMGGEGRRVDGGRLLTVPLWSSVELGLDNHISKK